MSASIPAEKAIFLEALEIGQPAERALFLDRSCGGNEQLRAAVEALLNSHERSLGLLDATSASLVSGERAGVQIGPYKLLEQIGEGGFGVVFMADQVQPVRRRVALKVIKPGMDTRQVIARFEAERQALALMDHPNIAKVLDAGTTDAGQPYFVMELVKGVPITEFCDQNELTPRERLELFIPVCQAVQHAHQKGIIHRDIKPTNVLVTLHDGTPVVKIIDFGIAKATGQQLTEKTLFTNFAQMIGTPLYMSPEQAEMNSLDIDTRSDIYSLGVLLYELLTGTTPFDKERLKQAAYDEVRRIIREEDPPRPSTRISTFGGASAAVSAQRKSDQRRLSQLFRGDLDWIVMKALEKDRNRRYETANALALDLHRYLDDEPVVARPPSAGYRLQKFVRRNKGPVLAGTLLMLALVVGIIGTTFGLIEACRERDAAEAARNQALQAQRAEAERAAGERQAKQAALAAAEAERHAKEAETKQRGIAEQEAARAEQHYVMAREVVDDLLVSVGEELAFKQPALQSLRKQLFDRALAYYETMVELQDDDPKAIADQAANHIRIARIKGIRGPVTEAIDHYQQAVVLLDKLARTEPETMKRQVELISTLNSHGVLLQVNGRYDDARQSYDRAISISEQLLRDHPDAVAIEQVLARSYNNRGWFASEAGSGSLSQRAEQALPYHQKALEIWERLARENPNSSAHEAKVAAVYSNIANRKLDTGRPAEALELFQKRLAIQQKLVQIHPKAFGVQMDLGSSYVRLADVYRRFPKQFDDWFERAVECYSKGREILERLVPDNSTNLGLTRELARTYLAFARTHRMHNDLTDALRWVERSVELREQWVQADSGNVEALASLSAGHDERGRILELAKRPDEAAQAYQRAIDIARQTIELAPKAQRFREEQRNYEVSLARVINNLAWRLATDSDPERRDAKRAVELAKKAVVLAPKDGNYCNTLGVSHYRVGDWKAAVVALQKAGALRKGGDSFDWFFLAMSHWQLGHQDEAQTWFDRAVEWMDEKQPKDEGLSRFRAEAEELLGVKVKQKD